MSLDVTLTMKGVQNLTDGESVILIRENGRIKQISREEWDRRYPDLEPVTVELPSDDDRVYDANITHNLVPMAKAAGIYRELWRPEEIGVTKAAQLIEPLRAGLARLGVDPTYFQTLNPANGWGDYVGLVCFVGKYLEACERYPEAEVSVSR